MVEQANLHIIDRWHASHRFTHREQDLKWLIRESRIAEQKRLIDIAQACLDHGYPLAVALEMMKGQNDG